MRQYADELDLAGYAPEAVVGDDWAATMRTAATKIEKSETDARWLSRLVYEFLLVGPGKRERLNEAEMERWLRIERRLAFYERVNARDND